MLIPASSATSSRRSPGVRRDRRCAGSPTSRGSSRSRRATFGTEWGWGADRDDARRLFDLYVERGGNVLDTATTYTDGTSERLLGEFARDRRESLVLATKYTTLRRPGDPNSGGPHRKNLFASVESSLRRLGTDHVDVLYLTGDP